MKNIHELIGIIKGINFDEVINEREVEHLKSWVNKNRNLACDSLQINFIRLVDQVLEDNIITEEEQQELIAESEKILMDNDSSSDAIYELNGIIQGIISDGILNDEEIMELNNWTDIHAEELMNHKPSKKLYNTIKDILEDGIITDDERQELLDILQDKITDHEFETKLAYLCSQVKLHNNIGIDLIDILDNDDAMDKIHIRAQKEMVQALQSYSGIGFSNPEIVFVSLCLIAMLEYDGSLFDSIRKVYCDVYRRFPQQKVDGLFRTIMKKYKAVNENISGKNRRYINIVLENAIVPKHFLGNFFDFIFDIYKINFECDLPDDLYDDFKFIYDGLKINMKSDGDIIKDSTTKKTYKLIETTKNLILNGRDIDSVIKLSIIIVKLIDKRFWEKEIKIYNPYLRQGYDKWNKSFSDRTEQAGSRHFSEWRSRWKPKYVMDNNKVYLIPPVHKVRNTYNYYDIYVQVLEDDKEIYRNTFPDIREIIAGYRIANERILIEQPLGKIEYRLMAGDKVIYKSNDYLNRKFIVFSADGEEIRNNTDYKGTAIICHNSDNVQLETYISTDNYKLCSKSVKYGDVLSVDGDVFRFTSLTKPGIFGEVYDNQYLKIKGDNKRIRVFKSIKYLVFENESIEGAYEITINSKPYKLSEFKYTVTERNGIMKYVVDMDLGKAGIYIIGIYYYNKGKRNNLKKFRVAYDPEFIKTLKKVDDISYSYHIESSLIGRIVEDYLNVLDLQEGIAEFEYNGSWYDYCIPFRFDAFSITNAFWKPFSDELWIGDISQDSEITIYDAEIDEIVVYSDKGLVLDTVSIKNKGVFSKADIGFLLSYKEMYDYVVIVFMYNGKVKKGMFCNNKCIMRDETEISFNSNTGILNVTPMFYGEGNVEFDIIDSSNEIVYNSGKILNNILVEVSNLESYEDYTIQFYEKNKGLGLSAKKKRIMKQFKYTFIRKGDMLGKEFLVKGAYIQSSDDDVTEYRVDNTYIKLTELMPDGRFDGEIYYSIKKGYRSNLIKKIDIYLYDDVCDGEIEFGITKKEKNLRIDSSRNRVSDSPNITGSEIDYYVAKLVS